MTAYRVPATLFERETPSLTSPVFGALARGTVVEVTERVEAYASNDASTDVWQRLANGRWLPQRLGGHEYGEAS
jgi:hypothetical protein